MYKDTGEENGSMSLSDKKKTTTHTHSLNDKYAHKMFREKGKRNNRYRFKGVCI